MSEQPVPPAADVPEHLSIEVLEEPPYVIPIEQHNYNKKPYCDKSRMLATILLVLSAVGIVLIGYFGNRGS